MIPLQLALAPEWAPERHARWPGPAVRVRGTAGTVPAQRPVGAGTGFWAIDPYPPYPGCEFGCADCTTRDTHRYAIERAGDGTYEEFRGREGWEAFERGVLSGRTARRAGERPIVLGAASDPYQPTEGRFGLTRRVLETLMGHRGLSLAIITKSPLIVRDLELLRRLKVRHDVTVSVVLATPDTVLLRRLEPRAPAPRARLALLEQLAGAGIEAGLLIAPILPGLTDGRRPLARLVAAARAAGAGYVQGATLRLGPAARRRCPPALAQVFPELAGPTR